MREQENERYRQRETLPYSAYSLKPPYSSYSSYLTLLYSCGRACSLRGRFYEREREIERGRERAREREIKKQRDRERLKTRE
mmetsp:Transcript_29989/g.89176  ORF Transcript_29989/g.89176 Transcript_29989/m.89176 type:complete len:82 (+) Transcript_29989:214-459(+)